MLPFYKRSRRPTVEDLAKGRRMSFGPGIDYEVIPHSERIEEMRRAAGQVLELLKARFAGSLGLDLTILRGHLVFEVVLNNAIKYLLPVDGDPERLRLSFPQKVELLHLLGGPSDPVLFGTLDLWNQLRNQLAHRTSFEIALVDRIIAINSDDSDEPRSPRTNRRRAQALRAITGYWAGAVMWAVIGMASATAPEEGDGGLTMQ